MPIQEEKLSQYTKLGKNVALITLGNFASKIMSFFLIPLYTAVLTTAEYGTADLMTTTINLLSPFFTLLISESVMRFALEQGKDKKQVFTIGLLMTIIGFGIMLLCTPLIFISKNIGPYINYFILYYLVTTLHLLISQFVKGIEKVAVYSLSGVLQTFCFILCNIIFLLGIKIGVTGYLLALIISNAFAVIFLWIGAGLSGYLVSIRKLNKPLMKEMLNYSIPMIPNSLSWWISNSSDKYLLTFFCGVAVTGVYSVSQRIPSLFSTISTIFMGAWQISAIEDFGSEKSRKFYSNIYNQYSVFNILTVSALICGCRILAKILFSKDFYSGWEYVPILLFAYLFFALSSFLGTIYTSAKKTKMLFVSTIVAAIANIALNIVIIPVWNAQGAAIATFVSYFLVWLIRLIDTRKIIKLNLQMKKDIVSYLLVTGQIVIMLLNFKSSFVISIIIFVALCIWNYHFLKGIIRYGVNIVLRRSNTVK